MSRRSAFLVAAVVALFAATASGPVGASTDDGIDGRLEFQPAWPGPLIARIDMMDGTTLVDTIPVDSDLPYGFTYSGTADVLNRRLTLKVIVVNPDTYVCPVASFAKEPGKRFFRAISIYRKTDAAAKILERSQSNPSAEAPSLEYAAGWGLPAPMQLHVHRTLASIYASEGDLKKQQETLSRALPSVSAAGPAVKRAYFTERLDNVLKTAGYGNSKLPERDFAYKIAYQPDSEIRQEWDSLIGDIASQYPNASVPTDVTSPVDAATQLKAVNKLLGRRDQQ